MYLRNVKQVLRQAEGGFDERRYGFGGLMDLLKALQREGFVRIERDRRGGLRVFQGNQTRQRMAAALPDNIGNVIPHRAAVVEESDTDPADERQPSHLLDPVRSVDTDVDADPADDGPMPIDPTAELLGRAKHRKPRVRTPRPVAIATARPRAGKPAAKKTAAPKRGTRKKAAASESE